MSVVKFALCCVLGLALLTSVVGGIQYQVDKAQCAAFGRESGYEVRFVRYTLVTWACLAQQSDGRWIPVENLREI